MAIDDLTEAEIAKFNKQERLEYEDTLKAYRDWFSVMETAEFKGHQKGLAEGREEGLAEGEAKGREEGKAEAVRENARSMKPEGLESALIARITGLTVEEIDSL